MPKELDDIEDMAAESSDAAALDVAADAGRPDAAAAASSSPATDETEVDAISIVRDVVDRREPAPAAAAPSAESEEAGEAVGDPAPAKAADDENFSDVPFNQHPRFKQLVRQRNEFRVDAERYNNVQTYIDQQGLSAEEAADGLLIMGLMKTDPAKAWEMLKPRVQTLLVAAGEVLPDDLKARVDRGELTRDGALEISRSRAALKSHEVRQTFQAQQSQRSETTAVQQAIKSTVDTWQQERQLKDPNFSAKLPRVMEKIAFLHATEGRPTDVDGTKRQLKQAYDAVNKEMSTLVPPARQPQRKPPVAPVRGGQVAGTVRSEGGSTLDIIRANRRQSA